jgi:hypothetical protein
LSRNHFENSEDIIMKNYILPNALKYLSAVFLFIVVVSFVKSNKDPGKKMINELSTINKSDSLEPGFKAPPFYARPHTWWHWINGHISLEGITRELEAMKSAGLGGFTLFNTSEGTPPGPVKYMSGKWFEMLEHTIDEARRLGLVMGIHNGAGWSSTGGPWVTPDRAMQEVVWTETYVKGPESYDSVLDIPEPALGIERDMRKDPEINKRYYVPRDKVRGYYRDIALLAFPALKSDRGDVPYRLENWRGKAGFVKLQEGFTPDSRTAPVSDRIDPEEIINLTSLLDSNVRLKWEVPPGEWTLLRIGYQPTGRQNHPAPPEGRGLEIDKLSSAAVDYYWKNSIAKIIHVAGEQIGSTFKELLIDSYEVGHQNWNVSFAQDFYNLRGYDLTFYLPALTGRIIKDVRTTESFLWDFRKTISDLIIRNYYGRVAELSRQSGLVFCAEAYGAYGNTDDFLASGVPDVPMTEWWSFDSRTSWSGARARLASSAAHTYGSKIVDSEAFTGPPSRIFEEYPNILKSQADYFFCQGVNRYSFHVFAHDPYNVPPGIGLGSYGSRFDSRNTWWPFARPWMDYIARCQYLLQQGQFIADMLYYTGEDAPQEAKPGNELNPQPPAGYDYDFCTREILEKIEVVDGRLVLPGGMSYRLLVLPSEQHMRPGVISVIENLVAAGATVVGPKPLYVSGLEGGEEAKMQLKEAAGRVWGECDGQSVTTHNYGKGRIYWGVPLEEVLSEVGVLPDFSFNVLDDKDFGLTQYEGNGIEFIHRKYGDIDLYFVSNQHDQSKVIEAIFRVGSQVPEFWNPANGEIGEACEYKTTADGRMAVTLRMDPSGSVFVVFRRPLKDEKGIVSVKRNGSLADVRFSSDKGKYYIHTSEAGEYSVELADGNIRTVNITGVPSPMDITGPWKVSFPKGRGAPEQVEINRLISLSEHSDPGVRYFSGTAVYHTQIEVPSEILSEGKKNILDLGNVQVIAEIFINGESQGIVWKDPYRVDISTSLKPGINEIEIRVANLWVNRLIGDQQYPDDCEWTTNTGSTAPGLGLAKMPDWLVNNKARPVQRKAFVTWKWQHLEDKEPLPSGLLGPVRLITEIERKFEK